MRQFNPQKFAAAPLFYLVILSGLGLVLRWHMVHPLPINYRFFVHAHSHTAFMGWVYNALFLLIIQFFVKKEDRGRRFFWYFVWLQVGVLGMLFSFPFQGYKAVSITFSTVHLVATAAVAVSFFRLLKHDNSPAAAFLRWALAYQLVSGLGPLLLGPLAAMGMKDSPWYSLAIYFFMHFQFNGWFVLGCLAIVFRWLGLQGWSISPLHAKRLVWLLAWPVAPAYFMSVIWTEETLPVYAISLASALLQIGGVYLLITEVWRPMGRLLRQPWVKGCIYLGLLLLVVKYLLQLAGSTPGVAGWIFSNLGLIIAFIHLIFLGVVSYLLFGFFLLAGWVKSTVLVKTGLVLLFAGFLLTEALLILLPTLHLVGVAVAFPYFHGLVAAAVFMFAGSIFITTGVPVRGTSVNE